ncbi:Uncharacterised protein [Vibrio cholerae]|nr:Uncharacterised protein [Vibrio cholerae]
MWGKVIDIDGVETMRFRFAQQCRFLNGQHFGF